MLTEEAISRGVHAERLLGHCLRGLRSATSSAPRAASRGADDDSSAPSRARQIRVAQFRARRVRRRAASNRVAGFMPVRSPTRIEVVEVDHQQLAGRRL